MAGAAREPQLLFTHCGGKARMASVVDALRAVSVPVIVVADFDVLREKGDIDKIVDSLGGDFSHYESDLALVSDALTADEQPLRKLPLRDELDQRIDAVPNETVSRKEAEALRAVIKPESGWDKAKRAWMSSVPQGHAHDACERLLGGLQAAGLFVVPVGELERFASGVPGHGPAWVTEVLEQKLHEEPNDESAVVVRGIRSAAGGDQRESTSAPLAGMPSVNARRRTKSAAW